MDKINEFLNHKLSDDFLFSDDKVMIKLEVCIDKLTKFKFPTGYLMEPIPKNELPAMPFGDFKKFDKKEIINQLAQKQSVDYSNSDRDALVGQLHQHRLQTQLTQREERRIKRREERLAKGETSNLSDDEFGDDYSFEHEDDDEDEDDDDKVEKESLMSNMTRPPTPQRSFSDFLSRSRISLTSQSFNPKSEQQQQQSTSKKDQDKMTTTNSNSKPPLNTSDRLGGVHSPTHSINHHKQSIYDTPQSSKSSPQSRLSSPGVSSRQSIYDINNNQQQQLYHHQPIMIQTISSPHKKPIATVSPIKVTNHQPQSVASIISNPPPVSPSAFLSSSPPQHTTTVIQQQKSSVTSIISHPNYYNQPGYSAVSPVAYQNYEYMRSPHGIYTRINMVPVNDQQPNGYVKSPSFRLNNNNSNSNNTTTTNNNNNNLANNNNITNNSSFNHLNLPTSSKQRTSSLRNVNNNNNRKNINNLVSSASASTMNNPSNVSLNSTNNRTNPPTKQQLQNHSIRIASLQQQQQQQQQQQYQQNLNAYNHYPTISIISQTPISPKPNGISSGYQMPPLPYHRNMPNQSSHSNHKLNKFNTMKNEDIIEQYDYI